MRCAIRGLVATALFHVVASTEASLNDAQVSPEMLEKDDVCSSQEPADQEACQLSMLQLRAGQQNSQAEAQAGEVSSMEQSFQLKAHKGSGGHSGGHAGGHGNYRTLYHQTSPEAGASILRTGFRPGTWHAICGSAIYFSPSISDTEHKAMGGRGFIIEATVDLGRMLHMPRDCDPSMTGAKLSSMGYDSITLDRGGYVECKGMAHCREYIIYDPRRVVKMRGFKHQGWKHWYGPGLAQENSTVAAEGAAQGAAEAVEAKAPEAQEAS